jgi:hypothetical protein
MTSCQYKQSTEQYALFKNKVDLFKDFSQKLILTVLSNALYNVGYTSLPEEYKIIKSRKTNLTYDNISIIIIVVLI